MAKNGPEVEAIDGPKERQKSEAELVKPPRVGHRFFLRQPQGPIDRRPHRHR